MRIEQWILKTESDADSQGLNGDKANAFYLIWVN